MKWIGLLVALGAVSVGAIQTQPRIRSVRSSGHSDTLRVEFEFQGGRPEAYRIGNFQNDKGKEFLRVQIAGASLHLNEPSKVPRWMTVEVQSGSAEFRIPVYGTLPWRAKWVGDTLRLEMPDKLRNPIWTYPLFVGTMGAGLVAGGVALWVYANGQEKPAPAPAPAVHKIPDPEFTFPEL